MQKITPFLWFDNQAEEAAGHYTSIFKNSKIVETSRYGEAGPGPKGSVNKDRFGLSWQVVPTVLNELMADKDPAKRQRVMKAMLQMVKLDVEGLKNAAAGK